MHFKTILSQIALASILSQVSADCQLANRADDEYGTVETDETLCKPQGEGDWTFSMQVSEVGVPADKDNAFAGLAGNYGFAIYDNTCALKGSYDPGQEGNDCGTPFVIMENFLQWVLTVKSIRVDLGGSYFSFAYGDGLFSINNNHCDCVPAPEGLEGVENCKCAFPVDGNSSSKKRSIEFKA